MSMALKLAALADAPRSGGTFLAEDADCWGWRRRDRRATGNPAAGIQHALACFGHKRHIVMVNVEADVLVGPMLARRAAEADVLYSMFYGDQPALVAEIVERARHSGQETRIRSFQSPLCKPGATTR
jgi:predicted homoserine dehydrogenase-like protein